MIDLEQLAKARAANDRGVLEVSWRASGPERWIGWHPEVGMVWLDKLDPTTWALETQRGAHQTMLDHDMDDPLMVLRDAERAMMRLLNAANEDVEPREVG